MERIEDINLKVLLKKLGRVFFYKKKSSNKVTCKIFGIPVYKRINLDYVTKKYLFGIRFYKKENSFPYIFECINREIEHHVTHLNHHINHLEIKIEEKINSFVNQITQEFFKLTHEMSNEISESLVACHLHKQVFPKYKNINEGRDVVIIATGPTLKDFKPIEDAIYIGVNRAFEYDKIMFDYLFLQDYSGATKTYINDFLSYHIESTKKFIGFIDFSAFGYSVMPDYFSNFQNVERYCTYHPMIKQQFNHDISCHPLGEHCSIVFPAIQFALWTHPKRIFIVGCDTNTKGYFNTDSENVLYLDEILAGWKKLKQFAEVYYPDIEIISVNPIGLKGMFKDEYQN